MVEYDFEYEFCNARAFRKSPSAAYSCASARARLISAVVASPSNSSRTRSFIMSARSTAIFTDSTVNLATSAPPSPVNGTACAPPETKPRTVVVMPSACEAIPSAIETAFTGTTAESASDFSSVFCSTSVSALKTQIRSWATASPAASSPSLKEACVARSAASVAMAPAYPETARS